MLSYAGQQRGSTACYCWLRRTLFCCWAVPSPPAAPAGSNLTLYAQHDPKARGCWAGLGLIELTCPRCTPTPCSLQKADVWSCGVLLYGLLTGKSAFQRTSDNQLGLVEQLQTLFQVSLGQAFCLMCFTVLRCYERGQPWPLLHMPPYGMGMPFCFLQAFHTHLVFASCLVSFARLCLPPVAGGLADSEPHPNDRLAAPQP